MQPLPVYEPITLEEQVLRQEKMGKLRALSDAILRAEDVGVWVVRDSGGSHRSYTPTQALRLSQLRQQYATLLATLPKLQVVT